MTEFPPKFVWKEIVRRVATFTTPVTHWCANNGIANRQSVFEIFGHSVMYSVVPTGNVKAEQDSEMVLQLKRERYFSSSTDGVILSPASSTFLVRRT